MSVKAGADTQGHVTQAKRVGGNITPDVLSVALRVFGYRLFRCRYRVGNGCRGYALTDWTVDVEHRSLNGDYDFPNQHIEHVTEDSGLPRPIGAAWSLSYRLRQTVPSMKIRMHATGMTPLTDV